MPSQALTNLKARLEDVDQLLNARETVIRLNNAIRASKKAKGKPGLTQVTAFTRALAKVPGRGRPSDVDAINRAAFVLLIAQFQGFVDDLHGEVGRLVLHGKARDPTAVLKLVRPPRSNPHFNVINQMFCGVGIYELMGSIRWQRCTNAIVKSRLASYIETRNQVAHGSKVVVTKARVVGLKQYIESLAAKLDSTVRSKAALVLGAPPW